MRSALRIAALWLTPLVGAEEIHPEDLLIDYCADCHDEDLKKGDFDLFEFLDTPGADGLVPFENLVSGKMPPAGKDRPTANEQAAVLHYLAGRQAPTTPQPFRRLSRYEFVQSANDLLGIDLDLAAEIPDDRGTRDFDSDRRIELGPETLGAYFKVADQMLDFALPPGGFPQENVWVTDKVRDSHETYNIYHRPYEDGILFSWTRANNGNSYSFFYDNFDPPAAGWYELTFDAAKVADFPEDVTLQVYAGKYYYADDRPQPQRLVGVISLGKREVESHTLRAFLRPGENVSVHCYSRHNFRQKNVQEGVYIRQLRARGPVYGGWPTASYRQIFAGLPLEAPVRPIIDHSGFRTNLQRIGGSVSVSSFQKGMGKERMQDGSHRTFWHTRFKPSLAEPPHYVILENPNGNRIEGLNYATWSGGNGNGQIEAYEIYHSEDGENWGDPIHTGRLEIRLANEQPIHFREASTKPYLKFLITEAFSLDDRFLASIGKLDVLTPLVEETSFTHITVRPSSEEDLPMVIRRFAERAFSTRLAPDELAPYTQVSIDHLAEHGDFVAAVRVGLKSVLTSPRFLMVPGEHPDTSFARAAELARTLWLSVPDAELLALAEGGGLEDGDSLRGQVTRMLADDRAGRMVDSFADQWLGLRSWDKVAPSLKLYPLYNDLLDHSLPLETSSYLRHLITENRPVTELIDSDYTFLNQRLARHYGIDGVVGQELRRVSFAPDVPRGGLLTMGSILKVTTDGYETSPILRGAWISKNLIGTPLSLPPEPVAAIEPEHGAEAASLREQIDQHKENKTCYGCHKSIDPYGFALESFDATGQWREHYRVRQEHNATFTYRPQGFYQLAAQIDPAGKIYEEPFDDIFGLKQILLSDHRKIAYNIAKKFFEYANGYPPTLPQRLDILGMVPEDPEATLTRDLITDIVVYSLTSG